MSGIDWSTVKVGDPDPTFAFYPDAVDDFCDAKTGEWLPFLCTREPHPDGPHVAGDGDTVVAVWR